MSGAAVGEEGGQVCDLERNMGQVLEDVRLAAGGTREVVFHGTAGGVVPSLVEVVEPLRPLLASPSIGAR